MGQVFIPITQAASGCSSSSSCGSAGSCGSGGSCGSAGGSVDPEFLLRQEGWVRRTTIGEPRLSEVVENYKAMGYEVHVEVFGTGDASCTVCYDAADKSADSQVWGTVYVRQGQTAGKNDELY